MDNDAELEYIEDDPFADWQDLDNEVKIQGGVLRVSMRDLRDLSGSMRLKVRVLATIAERLADLGIGYLPEDLPGDQHAHVVLYKIGSEAGAVIAAVRNGSSSERAESALRQLNTAKSTAAKREYDLKAKELAEQIDALDEVARDMRTIIERQ